MQSNIGINARKEVAAITDSSAVGRGDLSPVDDEVLRERLRRIDGMFHPRGIAIIGTSRRRGYFWVRLQRNFKGKLYPVNPAEGDYIKEVGLKAYPDIKDVPDPVDYAIIAVPADLVPNVLNDCAARGIKGCTVFSSGFSELGTEEGRHREGEIKRVARETGLLVIGPNCMGIYCPTSGMGFHMDLITEPGDVGFIAQSGGHAMSVTLVAYYNGVRFSKAVSYGNAAVVDSTDLIEYFTYDNETRIIAAYIEGVKDGGRFIRVLREACRRKPVIIWRGGCTESGARAAASHTGSIAGSNIIWSTVLRQCGAVEVKSFEELIDAMVMFSRSPVPQGRRIGVVSISGGQSVVLTDSCILSGLRVPELTDEASKALAPLVGEVGSSVRNPIDMAVAWYSPIGVRKVLKILDRDKSTDATLLEITPHHAATAAMEKEVEFPNKAHCRIISKFSDNKNKPLIMVISPSHKNDEAVRIREYLVGAGLPVYQNAERAARAYVHMLEYYERLKKMDGAE